MSDATEPGQIPDQAEEPAQGTRASRRAISIIIVIVLLGVLIGWKALAGSGPGSVDSGSVDGSSAGGSITSVHNDAMADYEAALETGKPIYILFHSLTCQPCIEISTTADRVVPDYADDIAFVNAITDDESGSQLASRFEFQYIPTSFFLAPDGTVIDSFTGAMDETAMRSRLDALAQGQ